MPTIQVKSVPHLGGKDVEVNPIGVPTVKIGGWHYAAAQLVQIAHDLEARTWETTVKDTGGGFYTIERYNDRLKISAPCGQRQLFTKENAENLIKKIKEVMDIT